MIFNPDLSKQAQEVIFSRKTKAKAPRCNIFVCMQCNLLRCMCLKKFPCSHLIRNSLQFFSFKIFTRRVSMSCTLKTLALLVLNEDENENANNQGEQEFWVHPWLAQRSMYGIFHSLSQELRHDGKSFKESLIMDESQFEYLFEKISAKLTKEDTVMRQCIKPHEMVALLLRHL